MPLVTAGRDHIAGILIGESLVDYNNASAHLGVGNGTTVFSAAHTDLQGASKARKAMDATYPTRATNVLTFRSTFASADANFAWDEVSLFNAATVGTMMSRVVTALGTKASGSSWVLTLTLTLTV